MPPDIREANVLLDQAVLLLKALMSKKSTQTNKVDWSPPPATVATTNLQNQVDNPVDYSVPIKNQYARAKTRLSNSYNSPLGAYTTADVRDKQLREQNLDLDQNLGMDLGNAAQQASADKFNRQATVAGLTSPQMYTASQTSKVSDPWGTALGLLGGGAAAAGSLMSGFGALSGAGAAGGQA